MNIVQRIAKNTGALFAAQSVTAILGLILTILIARILGDVQFGKYTFVLSFTALFGVFIGLGYSTLLIREVARDKSLAGKYFANVSAIYLLMSVIIYIAMVITINLMHYPTDTKLLVYLLGISTILGSFASICRVTFRAFEKMEYEMYTVMIREVARGGLGIAVLLMGYSLRELAFVFVFSSALDILVSVFICSKKFTKPRIEVDWEFWKKTIKIAAPLALLSIFGFIYVRIDTLMLSTMKGDAVVGWYNAAYYLVLGLKPFPQWFLNALFPLISAYFISSISSLKFVYEKSFKYLFILALPLATGIMMLADRFILLFYGPAFENSIIALQILAWEASLLFIYGTLGAMLVSMDKQNLMAIVAGISALLNVVLNLLLIPRFSYVGAAIATIVTETALFGMYYYLVSKYLTRLPLHKIVISPIIACAVMAVFIHFCSDINLGALIIAAVVIYFIVLCLMKGISHEDISLFKQVFKKYRK